MTKDKTPQALADDDLDTVQGAGGKDSRDSYANLETNYLKQPAKSGKNSGIILSDETETILMDKDTKKVIAGSGDGGI